MRDIVCTDADFWLVLLSQKALKLQAYFCLSKKNQKKSPFVLDIAVALW